MFVRKTTLFILGVSVLALSCVSGEVFADDAMLKLQRGAVNTTTGWMELGKQPMEGAKSDAPISGAVMGIGKGVMMGFQRTGIGLADMLSFPVKPYEQPRMEPETVFGDLP